MPKAEKAKKQAKTYNLPGKDEILNFIRDSRPPATKREISRAFGIKGPDKVFLKKALRELLDDGIIIRDRDRSFRLADSLPSVVVITYKGLDEYGEVIAKPAQWDRDGKPPVIYIPSTKYRRGRHGGSRGENQAMGPNDRALARIEPHPSEENAYTAKIIKILKPIPDGILGVFHGGENGGRVHPIDKKSPGEILIPIDSTGGAVDGELVLVDIYKSARKERGLTQGKVRERLGDVLSPKSISLIAVHAHDIPIEFSAPAIEEAKNAKPASLNGRVDLRDIPLITIDPADARDHDDAIFAEADTDPSNEGGWHVIVAIADVAHYVKPNSALDRDAKNRGNSCYFPDRIIPMLPEELSADLCSLRPGEDRACIAVHMWFDKNGHKLRHEFVRGLMKSHANISYNEVQSALDGMPNDKTGPLVDPILKPLHGAFKSLMIAHKMREPLDLDIPERRIELSDDGKIERITLRERFDAHRIVEEFMIAANVAAAEALEKHKTAVMYRVHDEPTFEKLENLREFLDSLDLTLAKGAVMLPRLFNSVLRRVKESPKEHLVNDVVLRTQTQAYYSHQNMGHFGLALPKYAHFTSPIRRYSDLLVHRGLISAYKLGDDGLTHEDLQEFADTAEHISKTERRAMAAERESTDRYLAAYMADHEGEEFSGRISGVSRFGLFVTLEPSGGDGLLPISSLGDDYYRLDETGHALVGDRFGNRYQLGDQIDVRLLEANRYTGGLRLSLAGSDGLPDFTRKGRHRKKSKNTKTRGKGTTPRRPGTAPKKGKHK